jgi:hypothetical protein
VVNDSFPNEFLFLIDSSNPWYGDVLLYLQTQRFHPQLSYDEHQRIHHHARQYLIIDDTLYCQGVDLILHQCLVHEEAEWVLNDFHAGACGGHLSRLATTQNIFMQDNFDPQFSKIVCMSSKSVTLVNSMLRKCMLILLHYIPWFPSVPSPNGGLIS